MSRREFRLNGNNSSVFFDEKFVLNLFYFITYLIITIITIKNNNSSKIESISKFTTPKSVKYYGNENSIRLETTSTSMVTSKGGVYGLQSKLLLT